MLYNFRAKLSKFLKIKKQWFLKIKTEGKVKYMRQNIIVLDSPCPVGPYEIPED
jgi:hypothetical protein